MVEVKVDSRQMICGRCHNPVAVSDIQYIPTGVGAKIALCSACRAKSNIVSSSGPVRRKEVPPGKNQYFCARCRYKFKFNSSGLSSLKCPYCGKNDKVKEYKDLSAQELIKTAHHDDF